MTLDELIQDIRAVSADPATRALADALICWKTDDDTVEELRESVGRRLRRLEEDDHSDYLRISRLWSEFRGDAIDGIQGMTMNERLFLFCLMDRFDASHAEEERRVVYSKLHAMP